MLGGGREEARGGPGCNDGGLNDVSGDVVLTKADVFDPVAALLWASTGGPTVVGVDVLPGPESRGGEYPIPILEGGGELSLRGCRPGLAGVDADRA